MWFKGLVHYHIEMRSLNGLVVGGVNQPKREMSQSTQSARVCTHIEMVHG